LFLNGIFETQFEIKIYNLCDSNGHTHTGAYLGKDRKCAAGTMTAIHTTLIGLTTRIENVGQKLYVNYFYPLLTYLMSCILRP